MIAKNVRQRVLNIQQSYDGHMYLMIQELDELERLAKIGLDITTPKKTIQDEYKRIMCVNGHSLPVIVTAVSLAIIVWFVDLIKAVMPVNAMIFLLSVQMLYVPLRWYIHGCRLTRGYY